MHALTEMVAIQSWCPLDTLKTVDSNDVALVEKAVVSGFRDQDSCNAWERIKNKLSKLSNNDKSETIKNCHTCLDFNGSCEHGPVSRCGCSKWVGSF
jgi:uncharacterized paraquat-inducible protein A